MNQWPSNWRERALLTLGVPMSHHAMEVMSAWKDSTPTEPWTNNPLGMPAHGNNVPRALNTPYASFPTFTAFLVALNRALSSETGTKIKEGLTSGDNMARLWRAIHSLNWPANNTETDHPSQVLDMVESKYRDTLATAEPSQRKTSGVVGTHRSAAEVLAHTANAFTQAQARMVAISKMTRQRYSGR